MHLYIAGPLLRCIWWWFWCTRSWSRGRRWWSHSTRWWSNRSHWSHWSHWRWGHSRWGSRRARCLSRCTRRCRWSHRPRRILYSRTWTFSKKSTNTNNYLFNRLELYKYSWWKEKIWHGKLFANDTFVGLRMFVFFFSHLSNFFKYFVGLDIINFFENILATIFDKKHVQIPNRLLISRAL